MPLPFTVKIQVNEVEPSEKYSGNLTLLDATFTWQLHFSMDENCLPDEGDENLLRSIDSFVGPDKTSLLDTARVSTQELIVLVRILMGPIKTLCDTHQRSIEVSNDLRSYPQDIQIVVLQIHNRFS